MTDKVFDLTKGGLPLVVAFGLFLTVGTICIKVGQVLEQNTKRETEVVALAKEVSALQRILITMRLSDPWTKADHVAFCWEAERINTSWRCPPVKDARAAVPTELQNK